MQMRQSHISASTQPPAIAWPLIAATIGFSHARTRVIARENRPMNTRISPRWRSISRGSASPAEKNRSCPVITAARAGPYSSSSICRSIESSIASSIAPPLAPVSRITQISPGSSALSWFSLMARS